MKKAGIDRRLLISLALVAALAGCGRSYLPTQYYRVDPAAQIEKSPDPIPLSLLVEEVWASAFYGLEVAYREGDYLLGTYPYSRWTETPDIIVFRALINGLSRAGIFRRIDSPVSALRSDLTLRSELRRFEQVRNNDGTELAADFELDLQIIDNRTGEIIWGFTAARKVPQKNEGTLAESMTEAVNGALEEIIASLRESETIRRTPSAVPGP